MIVLIGGEKDGTGKTTRATNLVAQRAQAGHDVLLVDTDRQGSASSWTQVRDASGRKLQVTCVQECGKGLQTAMRDLARRYADVSINAGGRDSVALRAGLVLADKASIPIHASQCDIWTLDYLDELGATVQSCNPDLRACVISARALPHPLVSEACEAHAILSDSARVDMATPIVYDRIASRRSGREGRSIGALSRSDQQAMAEISFFSQEVFDDANIVSASSRAS